MGEARRGTGLRWGCGCLVILLAAFVVTAPFTLMGPAVFMDSQREVLGRATSPDGRRIAQVERLVVGGAPSIVVTLRRSWQPDWYLTTCKVVSHRGETTARLRWSGDRALDVESPSPDWGGDPPFRWGGPLRGPPACPPVFVRIHRPLPSRGTIP
ncbi:MAG: hypothetical protein QOJ94_1454 [Sphingomonadales bacterium]|jgi:hypothetical protein|nr:hypothetical protein [Sphingomonadales bacterium]